MRDFATGPRYFALAPGIGPQETLEQVPPPRPAYQEYPDRGCCGDDRRVQRPDRTQIEQPREGWHERDRQQPDQQGDRQPRRTAVTARFVPARPEPARRSWRDDRASCPAPRGPGVPTRRARPPVCPP